MRIDNSRAKKFHHCPWAYYERYEANLEPAQRGEALPFGTRLHQLLEEHYKGLPSGSLFPACENPLIENEVQAMFAAYKAHYPEEPFEVVATEQFFELPLPRSKCTHCEGTSAEAEVTPDRYRCLRCGFESTVHSYIGEFDAIVRMKDTGRLKVFETKSEKRNSKNNLPQVWAAKPQVGLYIWAAEQIYQEPFDGIILNVCTRQSPAGREPCSFRRDNLERSIEDKVRAVNNIIWAADQIERTRQQFGDGVWPFDGERCCEMNWRCDYYDLHVIGKTEETLTKFKPAEEYLAL